MFCISTVFNIELTMEIFNNNVYSDSLRKRRIAHCYGEPCACGLHCASLEVRHHVLGLEWKRSRTFPTLHRPRIAPSLLSLTRDGLRSPIVDTSEEATARVDVTPLDWAGRLRGL